jgi:hypothetical protein
LDKRRTEMGIETFITKETLYAGKEYTIPHGAKYFRGQENKIFFYRAKPENDEDNGFEKIRKGATIVVYPHYRKHMNHTNYGEPEQK